MKIPIRSPRLRSPMWPRSCIITRPRGLAGVSRNDKDEFRFSSDAPGGERPTPGEETAGDYRKIGRLSPRKGVASTECAVSGVRHDRANVADPSLVDHLRGRT